MARVSKADGQTYETQPKNGKDFQLKEMKDIVNGYIEIVYLRDGRLMVVNEEGRLERLPYNMTASLLAGETIVGDVLVCERNQIK